MIKIFIYQTAQKKDSFTEKALGEYIKRLSRIASVRFRKLSLAPPDAFYFNLYGTPVESPKLAQLFSEKLQAKNELHLVLGVPKTGGQSFQLVSLPLTPGTQSVLLLEQVYRTFKINAGEPYHK